jgi:hypothetical protein
MVFGNDGADEKTSIENSPTEESESIENESGIDLTDPLEESGLGEGWTSLEEVEGWSEDEVSELEGEADSQDKFNCNHDPSKRDFVVVPKSGGVNIMGSGLQAGGGIVKHGCTVCGELHDVDNREEDNTNTFSL